MRALRRLWRSTFGLAAIVSILFAVATLAIGLVAYEVTHEALEKQLDHRITVETRALLAEPGNDRLAALAAAIRRREVIGEVDHISYLLLDARGRRVAGSLIATPTRTGYDEFLPIGGGRVAQAMTTPVAGGQLIVAVDRQALGETDRDLLTLFAVALGGLLVLGVGSAWTIGAITRARLDRIDRAALEIISGDLTRRMPVDGSGSEFDRVSTTLNRMLDRIGALMDNLRQVSSDVAHDLRSPLTRLSNRLHDARMLADDGERRDALEAAAAEAAEILEIFAALLRISEVEGMSVRRHFRPVALGETIGELIETYRPDAEASGHHLIDEVDRHVVVPGDRRLLLQLVSNLLDNALRHTPSGTHIAVSLKSLENVIVLRVEDNGPGVGSTDAKRLFERFSRAEQSRSSEGHDLGLALVRAIANAHYGNAQILPSEGFVIEVRMAAFETDSG